MLYCPRSGSKASQVKGTRATEVPYCCSVSRPVLFIKGMKSGVLPLMGRFRPRRVMTCATAVSLHPM